jgi:hypothetical protein
MKRPRPPQPITPMAICELRVVPRTRSARTTVSAPVAAMLPRKWRRDNG